MNSFLFFKRVISNKVYWLSVMAAFLLLCCSIVYTDIQTGEKFIFISIFYNETLQQYVQLGLIPIKEFFLGFDKSYLWMFCPIIVGIPCVLNQRTERFVLFRTSKNRYCFSKLFSNLFLGGFILVLAYALFFSCGIFLGQELFLDMLLIKKLVSVLCWGIINTIPSLVLAEFVNNKYLILCIPFVLNYFIYNLTDKMIGIEVWEYIYPYNYQMIFLYEEYKRNIELVLMLVAIIICVFFVKLVMERRCDCGQ